MRSKMRERVALLLKTPLLNPQKVHASRHYAVHVSWTLNETLTLDSRVRLSATAPLRCLLRSLQHSYWTMSTMPRSTGGQRVKTAHRSACQSETRARCSPHKVSRSFFAAHIAPMSFLFLRREERRRAVIVIRDDHGAFLEKSQRGRIQMASLFQCLKYSKALVRHRQRKT